MIALSALPTCMLTYYIQTAPVALAEPDNSPAPSLCIVFNRVVFSLFSLFCFK